MKSTLPETGTAMSYLCILACPSVKSDVACQSVCFLGCGLVSLKKRGCRASCGKNKMRMFHFDYRH